MSNNKGSFIVNYSRNEISPSTPPQSYFLMSGVNNSDGTPNTIVKLSNTSIQLNPVISVDSAGNIVNSTGGIIDNIPINNNDTYEVFMNVSDRYIDTPVIVTTIQPENQNPNTIWVDNTFYPPSVKILNDGGAWIDTVATPPVGKIIITDGILTFENYTFSNRFRYSTNSDKEEIVSWSRSVSRSVSLEEVVNGIHVKDNYDIYLPEEFSTSIVRILSSEGYGSFRFIAGTNTTIYLPVSDGWSGDTIPAFSHGKLYQLMYSYGTWYADGGRAMGV